MSIITVPELTSSIRKGTTWWESREKRNTNHDGWEWFFHMPHSCNMLLCWSEFCFFVSVTTFISTGEQKVITYLVPSFHKYLTPGSEHLVPLEFRSYSTPSLLLIVEPKNDHIWQDSLNIICDFSSLILNQFIKIWLTF